MAKIPTFTGGSDSARGKLNQLVAVVNTLQTLTGDGVIQVDRTGSGHAFRLSVERLLPLIPKVGLGSRVCWGKVKWDWAAAYPRTVDVNPCQDEWGNDTDTDTVVIVYVTYSQDHPPDWCPLVVGDVISYVPCTGENFLQTETWAAGVMVGGGDFIPPVPNKALDYMLVWNAATQTRKWIRTSSTCTPPA